VIITIAAGVVNRGILLLLSNAVLHQWQDIFSPDEGPEFGGMSFGSSCRNSPMMTKSVCGWIKLDDWPHGSS